MMQWKDAAPPVVVRRKASRSLDWWLAVLLLGHGAIVLFPGAIVAGPVLSRILVNLPEPVWGSICVSVALARVVALWINGRMYEGAPIIRGVGAAFGCGLWGLQLGFAIHVSLRVGGLTPGLWMYACLAGCDFQNAVRAGSDFIHARRARRGVER